MVIQVNDKIKSYKCFYCKKRFEVDESDDKDIARYTKKFDSHIRNCDGRKEQDRKKREGIINWKGSEILGHFRLSYDGMGNKKSEKVHPNSFTTDLRILQLKNKKLRLERNGKPEDVTFFVRNNKDFKIPKKIMDKLKKQIIVEKLKR